MKPRTYARLKRHDGIWRVDGIGQIQAKSGLGARAIVYFSGVKGTGLDKPYWKDSLSGETLPLPVHTASLIDFKVGSLWREGKRISEPPEQQSIFSIDVSQTRLVTLGEAVNLNGHWVKTVVPDSNFSLGANRLPLAPTIYALVPVLGDYMTQWLVTPASELLRFYAGISGRLLSATLQGRLENFLDWDKSRMEGGRPILHVNQRLSRLEAHVLARAIASEPAKVALLNPHQHLASTQANNALSTDAKRPLVIKAGFPFTDATSLKVAGKRMPLTSGNKKEWAVFAMEIIHCFHPPIFSRPIQESDIAFEGRGSGEEANAGDVPPNHNPTSNEDKDQSELSEEPADQRLRRLVVRTYTNPFSAFEGLTFEYRRPPAKLGNKRSGMQIDVPVNAVTPEDGSNAKDAHGNLGISDFQHQVSHVDRDLSLFIQMLQHLRLATTERGWKLITRARGDSRLLQHKELITFFPEKIDKRHTWHMVVNPSGHTRPRQVVWVELALGVQRPYAYLLEMELKPGESGQCTILVHSHDFSKLEEKTFTELLVLTAVQNRWPDHDNKWRKSKHQKRAKILFEQICVHRINHPSAPKTEAGIKMQLSPKSWSKGLLEKIDERLLEP